jgi:prephenate dehydratase
MSFSVNDKPGALFDALHVLSVHKLNMKKLESRPILGKPWEYSFFIETEIPNEAAYRDVVEELKGATQTLRQHGVFFAG